MKKIKIFDTNVFLTDPKAIFNYPKELVVIPISVIEELDDFKKGLNELGRNARHILKKIDKLKKRGSLSGKNKKSSRSKKNELGVPLDNGGRLIIELNHTNKIPEGLSKDKVDNRIIAVAIYYRETYPNSDVKLISLDHAVRIIAEANDVHAEDYLHSSTVPIDQIFKGYREVTITNEEAKEYQTSRKINYPLEKLKDYHVNEFIKITKDEQITDKSKFILCRYDLENQQIIPYHSQAMNKLSSKWNIRLDNDEQMLALDALLNPDIPLVTMTGKAGTGKTLLAIACALHLITSEESNEFSKILISRPVIPMGKDIGYLPGDINEKMSPWMQPIFDNLEYLYENNYSNHKKEGTIANHDDLIKKGIIKIEPLMYIRGRSIPNQFMIIDEAQNLTYLEIKTIITRAGKGTKLVFTGDPEQIDNTYVDSVTNGLSQIIEKLKDQKLAAHIHLKKGERSDLAEMASEILK